jgi:hypothetical protein
MTVSVAVVCEAPADRITITTLAERVIREVAPWVEPETVGDYVEWRGFRRADPHLEWTALDPIADELKLVIRFRDVHPLHPYAQNALRAIRVLARSPDRVDAIILVADSDGDGQRLAGLNQARDYARETLPIVVGLPHTKRECWHICGFEPADDDERRLLAEVAAELGGDARTRTEELTAKHSTDKRSAKRVLSKLGGDDPERELRCLTGLGLDELTRRGANNGLAGFVGQLRTGLGPLFAPITPAGS